MQSNVKVTKITHGVPVGTSIPQNLTPGDIGIWVEQKLAANGYDMNPGKGPDLLDLGCEVKSRIIESKSARTIGGSTLNEIINTPYDDSHIKAKAQQIYEVLHSKDYGDVIKEGIVDFSSSACQEILRDGYERIQHYLKTVSPKTKYVRGNKHMIAEKQSNGAWHIRLTHYGWKNLVAVGEQQKALKELFD